LENQRPPLAAQGIKVSYVNAVRNGLTAFCRYASPDGLIPESFAHADDPIHPLQAPGNDPLVKLVRKDEIPAMEGHDNRHMIEHP